MKRVRLAPTILSFMVLSMHGCSRAQPHAEPTSTTSAPSAPAMEVNVMNAFGPTVAGRFYPGDATTLERDVRGYLAAAAAPDERVPHSHRLVGIIAPHAGYVYSGSVAGYAYATLASSDVRAVIVMGPSHRGRRNHACTLDADVYRTPLGDVPIAHEIRRKLLSEASDVMQIDEAIFDGEHSVDVHIPFIKLALPGARIVPIIVPTMSAQRLDELAAALHKVIGADPTVLVVASSDLSHFFDYDTARSVDASIVSDIAQQRADKLLSEHDARRGPCGAAPIAVALGYLGRLGGSVTRLKVLNSGDGPQGDRDRVVGYPALALSVPRADAAR